MKKVGDGAGNTEFEGFAKGFDVFCFEFFEDCVGEVLGEGLEDLEQTRHDGLLDGGDVVSRGLIGEIERPGPPFLFRDNIPRSIHSITYHIHMHN